MEVLQVNATSNLFVVQLGGVVITNCTKDADCPGRAYCGINETWSALPNMCYCDFVYDHTGANCEDLTPNGWFFYIFHILATIVSTFSFLVAMYDLFRLIKWKKLQRDALSTSLIFVILATFWAALLTGAASRFAVQVVPPDEFGSKQDLSPIGRVTTVFVFLFSTLSMMNVSLVWIEITKNAEKMQRSQSHNIERYRNFLGVYYFVYMIVIITSLALNEFTIAAGAAIAGIVFIIVSYLFGFFKMQKMLIAYLTSEGGSSSNGVPGSLNVNKDSIRKIKRSLRSIKWTALSLSFCASNVMIFFGLWIVQGGFVDEPNSGISLIFLSLAWVAVAAANTSVVNYLHDSINRKVEQLIKNDATRGSIVVINTYSETPAKATNESASFFRRDRPSHEASTLGPIIASVAASSAPQDLEV